MVRMLWPRIVYWTGFALTLLGLFYAMTGINDRPDWDLAARSDTQAGGGLFALIGVAMLMGAKPWMDLVVRSRSRLACPNCGHKGHFTAMHCVACGAALRAADHAPAAIRPLAIVCQHCGQTNPPASRFCSSCAVMLSPRAAPA